MAFPVRLPAWLYADSVAFPSNQCHCHHAILNNICICILVRLYSRVRQACRRHWFMHVSQGCVKTWKGEQPEARCDTVVLCLVEWRVPLHNYRIRVKNAQHVGSWNCQGYDVISCHTLHVLQYVGCIMESSVTVYADVHLGVAWLRHIGNHGNRSPRRAGL